MPQIICRDLVLGYDKKIVSSNISFEINKGDYLCIVGDNGSGKSTLMKALLGLVPTMGGVIERADGLAERDIGYLPQQTELQRDFPASVEEVVLSGCIGHKGFFPIYRMSDKIRAHKNLRKLNIDGLQKRPYSELSGGQQQRVLLARALCAADKMILMDEPVSGLDPAATLEMYRITESLNRDDGMTVIMISHDIEAAVKYATHILHLAHEPLFFGTKEDYIKSGVYRRAGEGGIRDERDV
ncbi:MAG: ABC transporter ATP-binding protein [Clostridia bacterium]|nr:ABC transporter ATP-binding protein [Clostridia bacterium]